MHELQGQTGFSGEPECLWLTEDDADRRMRLLKAFAFIDRAGRKWEAPVDACIDGASIPSSLWALIGAPFVGNYRRASIVHDCAVRRANGDFFARRQADKMFYEACRAGGCSVGFSIMLYIGVRIGAWLPSYLLEMRAEASVSQSAHDLAVQADFRSVCTLVLEHQETDDPSLIELHTDAALQAALANEPMYAEAATNERQLLESGNAS